MKPDAVVSLKKRNGSGNKVETVARPLSQTAMQEAPGSIEISNGL